MTENRIIHNENRPARPEPGEDEATQMPPVREQAGRQVSPREHERAEQEERERQTGEP
ncbi:MAG TPA: hypothetical protein VHK90_08605 [Thermoanaerobaculia bacterium]|nr:hypothetical protein [Thermoanaerobaculia bacterium]